MNDDGLAAIVAERQAAWTAAFARRDAAALAALYWPDAQFWGSMPALFLGQAGITEYFRTLPASFTASRYDPPHLLALGPDAVSASGTVVFTRQVDGHPTQLLFRMTQVFVRRDGSWRIAVHHASAMPA